MAKTFEKSLVKEDRLGCITPKVKLQVLKGGQNITCQHFKAISETKASRVYNATVPSLETISREVLWQSTVTLKITTTSKASEDFAVNYGVTDPQSSDNHDRNHQQQHHLAEHDGHSSDFATHGGRRGVCKARLHDANCTGLPC